MNKLTPLIKGQRGWITQSILDFAQLYGPIRYRDLDRFYLTVCQGKPDGRSSSFNHHLVSLVKPVNRRCGRYLSKQRDGLYIVKWSRRPIEK